jgi:hypothetical protein
MDFEICAKLWDELQRTALAGDEMSEMSIKWCQHIVEAADNDQERIVLLGCLLRKEQEDPPAPAGGRTPHMVGQALDDFVTWSGSGRKSRAFGDMTGEEGSDEVKLHADALSHTEEFDPVTAMLRKEEGLWAAAALAASSSAGPVPAASAAASAASSSAGPLPAATAPAEVEPPPYTASPPAAADAVEISGEAGEISVQELELAALLASAMDEQPLVSSESAAASVDTPSSASAAASSAPASSAVEAVQPLKVRIMSEGSVIYDLGGGSMTAFREGLGREGPDPVAAGAG